MIFVTVFNVSKKFEAVLTINTVQTAKVIHASYYPRMKYLSNAKYCIVAQIINSVLTY